MKPVLLVISILSVIVLSGCGGIESSGGSSNNMPSTSINTVNAPALSVNDSSTVPVVNGTSTSGVLFIHNYSSSDISGITINLQAAGTTNRLQKKIKLAKTRANTINDSNGFTLVNPAECSVIKAGSSCGLKFTTPALVAGDQNSAVVKLNYTDTSQNNHATTIYTIVNYKYIDTTQFNGLQFFDDGVTAIMESRATQYTTSYLVSGGAPGVIHDDAVLNIDKSGNVAIASGFSNKTQISAGLAIPIEFLTVLNGSEEVTALVAPMDNNGSNLISKQNNTPVQIRIKASGSHIHIGYLPIINLADNQSQTVAVVNDGSDNVAAGAFTVTSSNNDIIVENGCSGGIASHASQICLVTFNFSKNMSGAGSAQIGYQVGGKTITQSTLNYTAESSPGGEPSQDNKSAPNLIVRANPSNIYGGINSTSTPITYTLYYDHSIRYQGVNIVSSITGSGLSAFNITGGSCGISSLNGTHELPSGSTCTIEGQYQTSGTAGNGSASLKFNFTSGGKNLNFDSDIITYTVTAAPDLTPTNPSVISETPRIVIFPQTDDDLSESGDYIFTIKNTGVSSAILNSYNLDAGTSNKTVPLIDNHTLNNACTQNQTLAVGESCAIRVSYGPLTPAERAYSESGIATLYINYHGEASNSIQALNLPLNYQHIGTDDVQVGVEFTGYNVNGDGLSANTAFVTDGHNNNPQGVTFVYTNHSKYYYLQNFSVTPPRYFSVDNANTTCGYPGAPHELAPLESCVYTIFVDKSALSSALVNTGDLEYLFEGQKISLPSAIYAVSFTHNNDHYDTDYKERPVEAAYDGFFLKYSQPLTIYSVSGQNSTAATVSLGLSGNYNNYSPINITYSINSDEYFWVLPLQTNSSNCSKNNDYSISCTLWDGNTYTPADILLSLDPNYFLNDPYSVLSTMEVNSTGSVSVPNNGNINLILQKP